MRIRKAVLEDAETVGEVHSKAWKQVYKKLFPAEYLLNDSAEKRKAEFLADIQDAGCTYFLLEEGNAAAGILKSNSAEDKLEISSIYILEEYRVKGFGTQALDFIKKISAQQTIFLWVLEKNEKAIAFYEKTGFKFALKTRTINRGAGFTQLMYEFQQ